MTFKSFVDSKDPQEKYLPLTHAMDGATFSKIIETGNIAPRKSCPVYDEYLVYAFYGRPSYRVNDKIDGAVTSETFAPVFVLLKPDVAAPKRVLPFDSGGFTNYKDYLYPTAELSDFQMSESLEAVGKSVKFFFSGNLKYYESEAESGLDVPPLEAAAHDYYDLISSRGVGDDDRRSAVELQFLSPLSLENNVVAVVLPQVLLDDEKVFAAIEGWGAMPLPYKFRKYTRASNYVTEVFSLVEDFYKKEKYW